VTSTGRSFRVRAPATRKARRPIVGSLTAGTSRLSDEERSVQHVLLVWSAACQLRIKMNENKINETSHT